MKQIVSAVGDNYIHIGGYSTTTIKTTIADIESAVIASRTKLMGAVFEFTTINCLYVSNLAYIF